MNVAFFIARRIYFGYREGKQIARPAVRIATIGMALSMVTMLLSLCVVLGFQYELRQKVIGLGAHIQVGNRYDNGSPESPPIDCPDTLLTALQQIDGVNHVQRFATKTGIVKTADAFHAIIYKGIAQEYDKNFLAAHLIEGQLPLFTDSVASGEVVISKRLAQQLGIGVGDMIYTYYILRQIRVRKLQVAGIYETHFHHFDNQVVIGDLYTALKLNKWQPQQASGIELSLADYSQLDAAYLQVADYLATQYDDEGYPYCAQTIEQRYPQLFAWLGVMDINVWVIAILMLGVSGFAMIAGLLILILERTQMIGVLKALGTPDGMIRRVFLYFATFIIGKGMFWGNVIGIALCLAQHYGHIIKLNAADYYIDAVPIHLTLPLWLTLNVATLAISVAILIVPSYLIAKVRPAQAIRFE